MFKKFIASILFCISAITIATVSVSATPQTFTDVNPNDWHYEYIEQMTKDGYLYVHGRMDNMIIKAGINIYPEEIEVAVNELEEISDSVVFKVINEDKTNIYLNYIGDITEDDLRKKLVSILNPNIIPNKIQKVETIAKTASGKKVRR